MPSWTFVVVSSSLLKSWLSSSYCPQPACESVRVHNYGWKNTEINITNMKLSGVVELVSVLTEVYSHGLCVCVCVLELGFSFSSWAVWFSGGHFGFSVVWVSTNCLAGRTAVATGQSGAAVRVPPLHRGKSFVLTLATFWWITLLFSFLLRAWLKRKESYHSVVFAQ